MARKFREVIAGRDHLMTTSTDLSRLFSVLPNGVPLWGGTAVPLGAPLPPNIDFNTHDWTLEFWFKVSSWGTASMLIASNAPASASGVNMFWRVVPNDAVGRVELQFYNTAGNQWGVIPSNTLSANTTYLVHFMVSADALSGECSINAGAPLVTSSITPTGTRNVVTNKSYFIVRGGAASQGVAEPALYRRKLTLEERAANYAAMFAS